VLMSLTANISCQTKRMNRQTRPLNGQRI